MKEYDKEKLNEYAKELFALLRYKQLEYLTDTDSITVRIGYVSYISYIDEERYKVKYNYILPIWKLIEKVKQL